MTLSVRCERNVRVDAGMGERNINTRCSSRSSSSSNFAIIGIVSVIPVYVYPYHRYEYHYYNYRYFSYLLVSIIFIDYLHYIHIFTITITAIKK